MTNSDDSTPEINTVNEYLLGARKGVIAPSPFITHPVFFVTKQQAYRFAAWLTTQAELLPDEELPSTFDEILDAIKNT